MSIMSTILRWFGDVYLIIDWVLLKKLQTQSHGWSAKKMADTESRLVCSKNGRHRVTAGLLKKWQKQSHGWSAQKKADTD